MTASSFSAGTTVSTRYSVTRLVAAWLANARARPLPAAERPLAQRRPGAARVVADPARAGHEDRVAGRAQMRRRHEPDELVGALHGG